MLSLAVALVAAIAALSVHLSCAEAFPFAPPDQGTPRSGYCLAIHGAEPALTLILGPTAAMFVLALLIGDHRRLLYGVAALIMLAVVANAFVAGSLDYAVPGP